MKKNEAMYSFFGKDYAHRCAECCNFSAGGMWFKCKRYGVSASLSTDWRKSWTACGKFNVPLDPGERPMIERLPPERKPTEQIAGQTCMWDSENKTRG
jgi:hypothetical protein